MALDATVGGGNSNSYVIRADADVYFTTRYNSIWDVVNPADKDAALVTASLALDASIDWIGAKTATTQAMEWPRIVASSYNIADNVIPEQVKQAVYEAAHILASGSNLGETSILDSVTIDTIEIDFNQDRPETLLPNNVLALISVLGSVKGISAGSIQTPRLVRV